MLAIVLRVFLLLELSLYTTIALRYLDAAPLAAGLFALAALLAVRIAVTGVTFVFAWKYRSTTSRLSVAQAIRMFFGECAAFIVNFVVISPFERWWMGSDRLPPGAGRPPLLLIHGYGCSRAAWWWYRRRLEAAGWTVATLNLEPIYTNIENFVAPVADRVDAVLAATGATRLVLVGHSMGGLVARAYLRRHGSARVARLITLGTPHAGSELARLGLGENARQMRPDNPWLNALAGEKLGVDTLAIYCPHDNYVMHRRTLELPGASLRAIDGLGHLAMLYSRRALAALFDGLRPLAGAQRD